MPRNRDLVAERHVVWIRETVDSEIGVGGARLRWMEISRDLTCWALSRAAVTSVGMVGRPSTSTRGGVFSCFARKEGNLILYKGKSELFFSFLFPRGVQNHAWRGEFFFEGAA